MKRLSFALVFVLILISLVLWGMRKVPLASETGKLYYLKNLNSTNELLEGDIIFQSSEYGQAKAIQLATKSKYSHCGIIFKDGSEYYVLEAVQPVKRTPLKAFIVRAADGHYVVKRLRNADEILSPEVLTKMKTIGGQLNGKDYDLTFEWSDDRIYCSELVWKLYKRAASIEIGKLKKLGEFDLSHPIVQQKLKERYGNNIPMNETVISPGSIFESELLVTVKAD